MCDHVPPRRLAEEEHRFQVGIDDRVPILFGEVHRVGAPDDARVVDQDVEPVELGDGFVDDAADRLDRRQVGGDDLRLPPQIANARHGVFGRRAADTGDVRTGRGQGDGDRLTNTGVGAGDDRHLAGEIEGIRHRAYASWQMSRTFMSV